jgi:hypothetical protein
MHHDKFHCPVFQHMARRPFTGSDIGHATGQCIHARQGADFAIIDNDEIKMRKAGADQFGKPLPVNAGELKIRLEAGSAGAFEYGNPAVHFVLPLSIEVLVNSWEAEMQVACSGRTEVKMIRRQNIGNAGIEDMSPPPGGFGDEGVGPLCGGVCADMHLRVSNACLFGE